MTLEQITLVKQTWKLFRDIEPTVVADTFYSKLFTDNSELRRMFPRNMNMQYQKLVAMINTIVARLDKWDEVSEELISMAKRHVDYGVRPGHYKLVGTALLWTLEQGLGKDWNPQVREAWMCCYARIANTMMGVDCEL